MKYINLENKFNVNLGKMKAEDDIFINCEMKEEIKTELDPECVMTDGSILKIEKKEEYFNQKGLYRGNFLVYDFCPPPPASYYFVHGSKMLDMDIVDHVAAAPGPAAP